MVAHYTIHLKQYQWGSILISPHIAIDKLQVTLVDKAADEIREVDLLRRADIEVVSAGLEAGPVTASRGMRLLPDITLDEGSDPAGTLQGRAVIAHAHHHVVPPRARA